MIVLQLRHGFGIDLWAAIMELGLLPSANIWLPQANTKAITLQAVIN